VLFRSGRIAPLNSRLGNGDQVEIITSKTQTPSPTWERFVVTGKARSHIRKFVRNQQRSEYVTLGKAMLQKIFRQEDYEYTEKAVTGILEQFRAEDSEDLYAKIGAGLLPERVVFKTIFPAHNTVAPRRPAEDLDQALNLRGPNPAGRDKPMLIKGLIPGMAMHFARCCHPLPGDRIVGIVTTGKGVTIHTIDCETLETFADTPERWLDVAWGDGTDSPEAHVGRLKVTFQNEQGAIANVSTVIAKNAGNITNFKVTNRSVDFWDVLVDVYVTDTKHLGNIVAALRATPLVSSVERSKGR
jgi:GTP pyrophosphokinase